MGFCVCFCCALFWDAAQPCILLTAILYKAGPLFNIVRLFVTGMQGWAPFYQTEVTCAVHTEHTMYNTKTGITHIHITRTHTHTHTHTHRTTPSAVHLQVSMQTHGNKAISDDE